ncbi:MAG: DUF418 domain-containing protein [Allomuricauda sp.]|nr:MAG: DUF418 domain-containing protein [Allomuricauda sp.]
MSNPTSAATQFQRINIIDALRGFALAGIVFTHMLENFIAAPVTPEVAEAMNPGMFDQIISGLTDFLFRGKFFALFSFLFGLSFYIQMDNGEKRGSYFGGRFLWRLVILFAIGFIHSMFYRGDILTLYALVGIFLIPFFKVNSKWILAFAALIFLGLGRYIVFYLTGGDPLFMAAELTPENPAIAEYIHVLQTGTFAEVAESNALQGNLWKAEFQFGVFNRGYLTLGFFLLGLLVGRMEYFKNYLTEKSFTKWLWIGGLLLMLVSFVGMAAIFASLGPNVNFKSWAPMFGLTFYDLMNLGMTAIIVSVFVILYKKKGAGSFLEKFIPYGKMALTNYVFQSIVGTFIFFGWGLGYITKIPSSIAFVIAIAVILAQMWLSKIWLNYFNYGPLEWVWRSATFFKWYPLKKRKG